MPIMNRDNPDWAEFAVLLCSPEGCNFRKDNEKGFIWTCKGGSDKSLSYRILKEIFEYSEDDIQKSLNYFESHGGRCDCEIIFNIDKKMRQYYDRRCYGFGFRLGNYGICCHYTKTT